MTDFLDMDGWTTTKRLKPNRGDLVVEAAYAPEPESCPKCGTVGQVQRWGTKEMQIRDAPVRGDRVMIEIMRRRYKCRSCAGTFLQPLPDVEDDRRMTVRCRELVEFQGVTIPYTQIAERIGLHEKTVRDICNEKFDAALKAYRPTAPGVLGIDELMLGGSRRAIFVDGIASKVIDLMPTMTRASVDRWLHVLPGKECVQIVTMDMWDAYRRSVQEVLPWASIVVDKWHIQSKAGMALDRVRARVRKASGSRKNPWANKRLLQTSRHRLGPQRELVLDGMLKNDPLLSAAWHAKEGFYDIWECKTREEAEALYAHWKAHLDASIAVEFGAVVKVVDAWHKEVFAYFDHASLGLPLTNAVTEALNGLIKIANRNGRGYAFKTIRAKAILALGEVEMGTCEVCGREFPQRMMVITHSGGGEVVPCPSCLRTHTQEGDAVHDDSTHKSE